MADALLQQARNAIDQLLSCISPSAKQSTAIHKKTISTSLAELQKTCVGKLTGEKGYNTVESGLRRHFIKGLVIHFKR